MTTGSRPNPGKLSLDADLQRRIEAHARAEGVTPSEVVRKAFEHYENETIHNGTSPTEEGEATAFDLLSRAGLIGCLQAAPEAPTDLATNPRHMEGFGRDRD